MNCPYVLGNGKRPLKCSFKVNGGVKGLCGFQRYCSCNGKYSNTDNMGNCKLLIDALAKEAEQKEAEALAEKQAEEEPIKAPKKTKKKATEIPVTETPVAEDNIVPEETSEEQ